MTTRFTSFESMRKLAIQLRAVGTAAGLAQILAHPVHYSKRPVVTRIMRNKNQMDTRNIECEFV